MTDRFPTQPAGGDQCLLSAHLHYFESLTGPLYCAYIGPFWSLFNGLSNYHYYNLLSRIDRARNIWFSSGEWNITVLFLNRQHVFLHIAPAPVCRCTLVIRLLNIASDSKNSQTTDVWSFRIQSTKSNRWHPCGSFFFLYILWLWHDAKLDQLSSEVDFNNFLICLLNLLSYVWISSFISIIIS